MPRLRAIALPLWHLLFLKVAAAMKRIVRRFRGVLIPLLALAAVDRVVLRKMIGARIAASL